MTTRKRLPEALPVWPAADLWPMLPPDDLDALRADIMKHGLVHPLVTYADADGKAWLLDGRNRLAALDGTDIAPTFTAYEGDDPDGLVLSANLQRRHLNVSQRALIYAMTVTTERHVHADVSNETSVENAAAASGIGRSRIIDARYLIEHKHREFIADVAAGVGSVSALAKIARHRDRETAEQERLDLEAEAAAASEAAEAARSEAEQLTTDASARARRIDEIELYAPHLAADFQVEGEDYSAVDMAALFEAYDAWTAQACQMVDTGIGQLEAMARVASSIASSLQPTAIRIAARHGRRLDPDAVDAALTQSQRAVHVLLESRDEMDQR